MVAAFASALMGAVVGWFVAWGLWTASVVPFHSGIQGLVIGTLTGLAQWLVLWRKVPRSGWWVPASAAGWTLAMAWQDAVFEHVGNLSGSLAEPAAVQLCIIVLAPTLFSGVALVLLLGQGSRTVAAAEPASSRPAG